MTVTASAAAVGSAIATGTVIVAHAVFRRRAGPDSGGSAFVCEELRSSREEDGARNGERGGGGGGLIWEGSVPQQWKDEANGRDDRRVEEFEGVESGEQDGSCCGGGSDKADTTKAVKA